MKIYKKTLLCALFVSLLLLISVVPGVSQGTTDNKTIINESIEKGVSYLSANQYPSGRFPVFMSYYPEMSPKIITVYAIYDTAFILRNLNLIDNENTTILVDEMKNKSVSFLMDEMIPPGIWSFRGKSIPEYPPDTDDTSIAFSALVESGVNMSDVTLDYMLNYTAPNGAFYLWMEPGNLMIDAAINANIPNYYVTKVIGDNLMIDAAINANILYAYALRNRSHEVSGVVRYLNNVSETKSFSNGTLYYTPYVYTYMVTKDYSDGNVRELAPSLSSIGEYLQETQKPDGSWGNDMDTALAAISLLNMGYEGPQLEMAMEYLLSAQREDGSWNIGPFYQWLHADLSPTGAVYYGSEELTTSCVLEALIKYRNSINKTTDKFIIDKNGFKYEIQSDGLYKITADTSVHYMGFGISGIYNGTHRAKLSSDFGWTYSEPVWNGDGYNLTGRTSSPLIMDNAWITRFMFTSEQTKFGNIIKNPYPDKITNSKFYYVVSLNNGDEIVFDGVSYTVTPDMRMHVSGNLNGKDPNLKINGTFLFDYTDLLTSGFNITDVYIANATDVGFNSPLKVSAIGFTKGDGILKSGQSIEIDPVIKGVFIG